jgi:outer membrane receptor protein involved in Fe transport
MRTVQKRRGFTAKETWFCPGENKIINYNFTLRPNCRMKIFKLLPCLIMLFPLLTFSQVQISGKVIDRNEKSMEFVNVFVTNPEGNDFIEGSITDSNGNFQLEVPAGTYEITASFLGYKTWSKTLNLSTNKDLGNIMLVEDATALQEVVVEAEEPLIEREVDRLVFNVDQSIASQGMSGIDALRNAPLVRVQASGGISIVGKSGVSIMINGRMLHLSGDQLTNYIQSLRSDDISKIEIITTPPAKYEAEGNSGIINIVLKKNRNIGWSGNVNGTYRKTTYDGFGFGATINYQSNRIATSLRLRQYDYSNRPVGTRNLIGSENSIYTSETRKDNSNAVGLNYGLDYKINNSQNIGFIYDFNSSHDNKDALGTSRYESSGVIDSTLVTFQEQRWETPTHTLNVYYDVKLDSAGKKISITGNYLSNMPDKVNDFKTLNSITRDEIVVRNSSYMDYNIYSGQADITLPHQWGTIETGAKYTLFENKSNVGYYNLVGSNYVTDSSKSSAFNYRERNYAAYISFQKDFNEKWSAKAGLRYEYTQLNGKVPGTTNSITRDVYGELFPTAYIRYNPNDIHTFTLSYSRRIERPSFRLLNPFRWYTNPYTYFTGTPTLSPSFNNNLELTYLFKNRFSFNLYHQYHKNGISNIARLVDGIYTNVFANSYNENRLGLQLSYNDTFFKVWEAAFSATGTYTSTKPTIPEAEGLNVYSLSYSVYNTITLNEDKTWFLLLNFWHNLPYVYANINLQNQLSFSPGIKASFFDEKLTASAVVNDLFKTLTSNGYSYNAGFRSEFTNYSDQRRLTISLSYSFGNNGVKRASKDIQFEEKSRAN